MVQVRSILAGLLAEMAAFYVEIAPYLLLGFAIAGLLYILFPDSFIKKHFGKSSIGSVFKAAVLGVPLPLCSCGVLPTAFSLRKQGASRGATASFLISTPQTGVDSILVTYAFLGPVFAVFRPVVAFVSGILGGLLINRFDVKEPPPATDAEGTAGEERFSQPWRKRIVTMCTYAFYEFPSGIARWMVLGIVLAGIISYAIPNDFFSRDFGSEFVSMLAVMIIGIPFYVCSTGSVPIAAALMMKGLSPGAAFVFLVTGPVTSVATITMVIRYLGKRFTGLYLATIIITSLLFGTVLNLFYAKAGMAHHMHHVHGSGNTVLTMLWAALLGVILVHIFIRQFIGWVQVKRGNTMNTAPAIELAVLGMTCQHCVNTVANAILAINKNAGVVVDLKKGLVKVEGGGVTPAQAAKAISEKGYTVQN